MERGCPTHKLLASWLAIVLVVVQFMESFHLAFKRDYFDAFIKASHLVYKLDDQFIHWWLIQKNTLQFSILYLQWMYLHCIVPRKYPQVLWGQTRDLDVGVYTEEVFKKYLCASTSPQLLGPISTKPLHIVSDIIIVNQRSLATAYIIK